MAVSPTATVTVMASKTTVTTGIARGRRSVGSIHAAQALATTATATDAHPGACCQSAQATMAVLVAATHPKGHESARDARGTEDMAPQYPANPTMAKGSAVSSYLSSMLPRCRAHRIPPLVLPMVATMLAAPLLAAPWPAAGESVPSPQPPAQARLDVGSFTLLTNGQRAGREQFSVQRVTSPDGGTLEVRSESAQDDRRVAMRLETDSAGTPVRYSVEERRGADVTLRLGGQRVRGRFATLARSSTGEAAREYLLRPGTVVVEDDGIVQYALLVRERTMAEGAGITLPSLTPIANTQGAVRLVLETSTDTIVVAGTRRAARRWRVTVSSGDLRLVWTDVEGRLLRLTIPARNLEAIRDDVPH
ncbi:MAG: hypothetical protein RL409_805 [Gemmatimonadota bacterium]